MNGQDEQRNRASMALLERMAKLADEIIEERDNQQRLEKSWQSRQNTPPAPDDETQADQPAATGE